MFFRAIAFSALLCVAMSQVQAVELDEYNPPAEGSVRILRDRFGVPHIVAQDERSLFYGVGYAQAEDQLENMELNFLRAQGRIAEREGQLSLRLDHIIRMLRVPQRAREHAAQLNPRFRTQLEGFSDGVNTYIKEHRDQLPDWIEPVEPFMVLAFADYVETLFSVSHALEDLDKAGIKTTMLDQPIPGTLPGGGRDLVFGSNQFAVRPHRSQTGSAMLSMDPHLPHSGFYRWYEMHLIGPDLNVMGACFFGSPYVSMGRTERTAWCMTVNAPDLADVFSFTINPDDKQQFKGIDGWENFETYDEVYKVRRGDKLGEVKLLVRRTPIGPVVAEQGGVAYAVALPLSESPMRFSQILDMSRAKNVEEFKRALEPLGLVMFNIVFADADGDIYYVSNGRVPRRDTRISSHDVRPGDQAWARWQGYHPLAELPQVLNPPCGYVLNTNSGPQNVCPDVAPQASSFPAYLMGQDHNSRSRRLTALLYADESISWEEMQSYAADTYLIAADQMVPLIADAVNQSAADSADKEMLTQAQGVLAAWDRRTDVDSKGAVLFNQVVTDPDFVKAMKASDTATICKVLANAAKEVKEKFSALDVAWGEFSRIRRGDADSEVAGSGTREARLGPLGLVALRPTYGGVQDGKRYCTGGSSYAMIVDFSGTTRAMSVLPFGESEDPKSPHFADQLPLYARGEYKPAWFLPAEVREHTESDRVLTAGK